MKVQCAEYDACVHDCRTGCPHAVPHELKEVGNCKVHCTHQGYLSLAGHVCGCVPVPEINPKKSYVCTEVDDDCREAGCFHAFPHIRNDDVHGMSSCKSKCDHPHSGYHTCLPTHDCKMLSADEMLQELLPLLKAKL